MSEQLFMFGSITPTLTEAEKKRRVMDRHERNKLRRAELDNLQKAIRHLIYSNPNGVRNGVPFTVTSDDLRKYLSIPREGRKNRDRWFTARNNLIGAAFRGFVRVGDKMATVDGSHGRRIGLWTLKQYENTVKSFLNSQNGSER